MCDHIWCVIKLFIFKSKKYTQKKNSQKHPRERQIEVNTWLPKLKDHILFVFHSLYFKFNWAF